MSVNQLLLPELHQGGGLCLSLGRAVLIGILGLKNTLHLNQINALVVTGQLPQLMVAAIRCGPNVAMLLSHLCVQTLVAHALLAVGMYCAT